MTTKLLKSRRASKDLFMHAREAQLPIRLSIYLALGLKWIFRKFLRFVPVVGTVDGPISGLLALHNEAEERVVPRASVEGCGERVALEEQFDLVIVGSGPGGAITAELSTRSGQRVLCIEKGHQLDPTVPHHSPAQMREHFDRGGQELIIGHKPIVFAQGKTWGGGSEINSGLYHRLPHRVADDWSRLIPSFTPENRIESERLVEKHLKISTQTPGQLGVYNSSPLPDMQAFLGWAGGVIPRWRTYADDSFTHHGMASTYLRSASKWGLLSIMDHEVTDVSRAVNGVDVMLSGRRCSHVIRAKQVCLAAGTVGTPKLLVQAGLARRTDLDFQFHAMLREIGIFPRVVNDLVDIDPYQIWAPDFGFKIGAAVGTRPLLASTLASRGLSQSSDFETHGIYYVSIPSSGKGGFLGPRFSLFPHFTPGPAMRINARQGVSTLRQAIQAAGGEPLGVAGDSMSTVHIFGSLPLGVSPVVDSHGYVQGTDQRIFVRDGSLLPSPPLVNPQGAIMHLVTNLELFRLGAG